jgi:hypothetical protein
MLAYSKKSILGEICILHCPLLQVAMMEFCTVKSITDDGEMARLHAAIQTVSEDNRK